MSNSKKKLTRQLFDYPPLLNIELASELAFMYNKAKLRQLCRDGVIPHIRLGRRYCIPRDTFWRWIEEQAVNSVNQVRISKLQRVK